MMKLPFGALLVGLLVACGGDDGKTVILPDAAPPVTVCNPLTQAGCEADERCTWLIDALEPQYVGHIGCVKDEGTAQAGEPCMFGAPGAAGFDNCVKGTVCGDYRGGEGICKQICDQQGGMPACDDEHACVTYSRLFRSDATQPNAAGVCDLRCDPLQDNDFDGAADTLTGAGSQRRTSTCGSAGNGCYGGPRASMPETAWSCTRDINADKAQPIGLRHRVQCVAANECADEDGTIYTNSCNQGYIPLLKESSFVSTTICTAICKPAPCYKDDCGGAQNLNRFGLADDACTDTDRIPGAGNDFSQYADGPDGGEHCIYSWYFEVNRESGQLFKSQTSDTVGFCFNHQVWKWDSDNDGMIEEAEDQSYPSCALLGSGYGSANYTGSDATIEFGALNLGCVPTSYIPAMSATGKLPPEMLKQQRRYELPRMLYHRTMGTR